MRGKLLMLLGAASLWVCGAMTGYQQARSVRYWLRAHRRIFRHLREALLTGRAEYRMDLRRRRARLQRRRCEPQELPRFPRAM
jgi:hypothetical protein